MKFVEEERKKLGISSPAQAKMKSADGSKSKKDGPDAAAEGASSVLAKLDEQGTNPFQIKLSKPKPKAKKKRKRPQLTLE